MSNGEDVFGGGGPRNCIQIVEDAKMRVNGPKRVTYVRAFWVAPSPNSLATSAMFGMDGEATFNMDISSLGMLACF